MTKPIKIIKNRSDIGAGTRGSDMGVDAIEIAAINQGNDYFNHFPFEDVATHNETIYSKVESNHAKRIRYVKEQCQRVSDSIHQTLNQSQFPLVISGDHSNALGTISGIKAQFPNKRLGVIWVDAHADLHTPFTTPSGNMHGKPLAIALAEDNISSQINQPNEQIVSQWEALKKIGTPNAKIKPEDLLFFGVRDTETPEDELMKRLNLKNYTVHEMRYRGFETCLKEATEKLTDCDLLYLSFDVDSMDCDMVSKGTGTPVSKGFDQPKLNKLSLLLSLRKN